MPDQFHFHPSFGRENKTCAISYFCLSCSLKNYAHLSNRPFAAVGKVELQWIHLNDVLKCDKEKLEIQLSGRALTISCKALSLSCSMKDQEK